VRSSKLGNVQALRAVAALMVVGDHIPREEHKLFPHGLVSGFGAAGATGVDMFFVISGFIMATTTWNSFGKPGASGSFLLRRILRIYPVWIVVVLFTATLNHISPSTLHADDPSLGHILMSLTLIPQNIMPLPQGGWSLQYEMFFYLVFAIALFFSRDKLGIILACWFVATLGLQWLGVATGWLAPSFAGSPLCFEFMAGVIVAWLARTGRIWKPELFLGVGIIGVICLAIYSSRYDGFGSLELTWFRTAAVGPFMVAIVYGAVCLEARGKFAPRPLVALGDASYTMYLWHGYCIGAFVLVYRHLHLHGTLGDIVFLLGCYPAAIAGSVLLYNLIEKPILRALQGLGKVAPDRNIIAPAATPP
jgi:exopolysaccharide production protein ExoZ